MRIVTVPNNVSYKELIEKVQAELNTMRPHIRALVLLESIRDKISLSAGMHTISCIPIKRTLHRDLCGQRADIIAVERADNITIRDLLTLSVILNDRSEDTGILICPKMMGALLE